MLTVEFDKLNIKEGDVALDAGCGFGRHSQEFMRRGKACQELSRILKTNGRIAITVPTTFSEILYFLLTYEYFTSPGGHVRIFTPKKLEKIMKDCGLEIYGIGFKHSFHTMWWNIRCVVGLHNDQHPLTKTYHKFLHYGLFSNTMRKIERFFNYFFPKSVVLYAWKK